MKINFLYILLLFAVLLSSCGAKKKANVPNSNVSHRSGAISSTNPTVIRSYYADLLGVREKDMNVDLYSYINQWMNVPHRLGGMNKSGIDCSGFVLLLYQNVYNKNLPRTSIDMSTIVKRKYEDQLKEGDLVFFSFGGKNIDHVGIYLHNNKFVHVSTTKGVMISNLSDKWYYKYFTRCGTPK